jgi:hypothetical protein
VVIFLELSVTYSILHADKYPRPPRGGNAPFCNEFLFGPLHQMNHPIHLLKRVATLCSVRVIPI